MQYNIQKLEFKQEKLDLLLRFLKIISWLEYEYDENKTLNGQYSFSVQYILILRI